jgi:hypothetical protein
MTNTVLVDSTDVRVGSVSFTEVPEVPREPALH